MFTDNKAQWNLLLLGVSNFKSKGFAPIVEFGPNTSSPQGIRHFLAVSVLPLSNGQNGDLHGREPKGEVPPCVLDINAHESFDGA